VAAGVLLRGLIAASSICLFSALWCSCGAAFETLPRSVRKVESAATPRVAARLIPFPDNRTPATFGDVRAWSNRQRAGVIAYLEDSSSTITGGRRRDSDRLFGHYAIRIFSSAL
jgi:hypothetical protein